MVLRNEKLTDWVKKINNKPLLDALVNLLKPFRDESEDVQANKGPTIQLCVSSLHVLIDHCQPDFTDEPEMAALRSRLLCNLEQKAQITLLHKIATFLWPSFRTLLMLSPQERTEVITASRIS